MARGLARGAMVAAFVLGLTSDASAKGAIGHKVPAFSLEQLNGHRVSAANLRGRPAVLVVGSTMGSAVSCKRWTAEVSGRHGAVLALYQVAVIDKPWIVPKSIVISKIRSMTPRSLQRRVLIEWAMKFADALGIPKTDDPVILALDDKGVVRWRHRGAVTPGALAGLAKALDAMATRSEGVSVALRSATDVDLSLAEGS